MDHTYPNLDLEKDFIQKTNIVNAENNYENIQEYMNNYSYKISYVNIDSRFRTINPQNIIEMYPIHLPNNPITTFTNEFRVQVNVPNHTFNIGDKIILQNILGKKIILNNPIYLISNYNYYMVYMENHMILPNYTIGDNYKIKVSLYEQATLNDRLIGNIPLNSIIGNHKIYVYDNNELFLPNNFRNRITTELNITIDELIKDYFFIKLPINYININNNNQQFTEFFNINKIFTFEFNNIGGINTYFLNANYPINALQYQAYHEIININENIIEFNSPAISIYSETSGGIIVMIGKVINILEGYPDANNYTLSLKKTFTDVISIEMISSEIPYIDYNVKNNITIKNNKLYWQYLEDGDYIYNVSLAEGSYFIDLLIEELQKSINSIQRVNSNIKEQIFNEFDIKYNIETQEINFISYNTKKLPYSLNLEQDPILGPGIIKLTITHPDNYVKVGDIITIFNSLDIGDISASLINISHTIYSINSQAQTYTILITTNQSLDNIDLSGDGGAKITIKVPILASFLFNYNDTMGELLGFKYVGQETSITPFSHITSNMNDYIYPTPFDTVGNISKINNYFTFSGQNYYMLVYLNDYENIYTTNNFNNAFAKIFMKGQPGDIIFNRQICAPLIFDIPIKSVNELKVKFLYPDGTMPDFRNLEHSFTLKITERISTPVRTGLNSSKMNYLDSLKELAFAQQNAPKAF